MVLMDTISLRVLAIFRVHIANLDMLQDLLVGGGGREHVGADPGHPRHGARVAQLVLLQQSGHSLNILIFNIYFIQIFPPFRMLYFTITVVEPDDILLL